MQPLFNNLRSGLMDVTLRSESLGTPSYAVDTWNNNLRMQSPGYSYDFWKKPTTSPPGTQRARMELYGERGGSRKELYTERSPDARHFSELSV